MSSPYLACARLYSLLANMLGKFLCLKPALVLILVFVGVKMLMVHSAFKINTAVSLAVVVRLLGVDVSAALLNPARTAPLVKDDR